MQLTILGNGGAINDGLPYNAFLIDDVLLCETPPDIMLSLARHSVDLSRLHAIYISHFHADHFFGLPLLMLNMFYNSIMTKNINKLKIFGPAGIEERVYHLVDLAFGRENPCNSLIKQNHSFITVNEDTDISLLETCQTSYYRMLHSEETYGFVLKKGNTSLFAYTADTLWGEPVSRILANKPKAALVDLNGREDDPKQVHMSEKDLIEKAMPITGKQTRYFGTHLKEDMISNIENLIYAKPGMEISVE